MNIRDLHYFITVAEKRHFGQAADACFVSQPTLSGQIRKLEDELGVDLLERTNRAVDLTPAGAGVLMHARNIMDEVEAIKLYAQSLQEPLAGPLRVGVIPTLSPYLMPHILTPLRKQFPDLQLAILEETTDQLEERLDAHEIDAALLATPINNPDFKAIELFDEPFWVAYPRKHRFATKDKVTLRDLVDEQILLLSEAHCLARQATELCQLEDRPTIEGSTEAVFRASSLETLIQMVRSGYGVTLIPALAQGSSFATGSGVVTKPLSIRNASRRVSLVSRRSFPRQEALQAFGGVVRDNLPDAVKLIKPRARKAS